MSYKVHQGDIFGRLGTSIGKSLSEEVPKEVERFRKIKGLEALEKDLPNLSPIQSGIRLGSIVGMTPQEFQTYGELIKQEGMNKAFTKPKAKQKAVEGITQAQPMLKTGETVAEPASLENIKAQEARRKPFIPKDPKQIEAEQTEKFDENPARYNNDVRQAIKEGYEIQQQEALINQAYQNEATAQDALRTEVKNAIGKKFETFNVDIPGRVRDDLEEKAARSLLPKAEGGEGLTKAQAADKYGKEADEISRQYQDLDNLTGSYLPGGIGTVLPGGTKTFHDSLESIRQDFEKRDDLRNFADQLQKNGISPEKSYFLTYPLKKQPEVAKIIKNAKLGIDVKTGLTFDEKGYPKIGFDKLRNETTKIAEEILPVIGNASPMAVIQALGKRGYDVDVLKQYFLKNKDKLKGWQADQLNKPLSKVNSLSDIWLFTNLGEDDMLE